MPPDVKSQRIDPRTAYPRPPFPVQQAGSPSELGDLEPRPDHGEESYVGAGRLAGLQAVITGGDSGIGRAVAIAFAREGADVMIGYLHDGDDASDTVALVQAAGRRGLSFASDLSNEANCRALVEHAHDLLGRIDILVNNAATQHRRENIEDVSTEEWERILRTNLTAPFWLCREAVSYIPAGGSIINVASIQASKPSPSLLAYATTKGGLVTFSSGAALPRLTSQDLRLVSPPSPRPMRTRAPSRVAVGSNVGAPTSGVSSATGRQLRLASQWTSPGWPAGSQRSTQA